ncbi:hypothetical protein [Streptomyces anandii]|uniref:hypothetical protein n=1 Tax=Streptomyces anandii TaxID=285454 RepID=UPI00167BA273|nr:hypothetical protein [Streptomyces anandii]GGX82438.1 hypothetical protein GCM10010510_29390 [Streptomyces anandii JCM 4720]
MKQRGRHRRRRRGRAVRAVLSGTALALTAAATLISTSQATVADNPGALERIASPAELGRLRLTEQPVPQLWLDRLQSAMGRPSGVQAVLDSADRTLRDERACTGEEKEALPVEPAATRAYCWDTADAASRQWQPESVTTSGDASEDGRWGGHRVILSGWTDSGDDAGGRGLARVAFVDADDPARLTYTWALLAVPVDGGRDYRGLVSHVSGMTWYRDKLLVTTSGGERDALYVYDLDRIQRATVTSDAIGRVPGGWSAHGYRWVLPAVASYRPTGGACDGPDGAAGQAAAGMPCPTGLSLDRTSAPDSLVASEAAPAGSGRHTRLWRYYFSPDPARSGLLVADSAGTVIAGEAYETKAAGVRGVLSRLEDPAGHAAWYLSRPAGPHGVRGTLWRQDLGGARAPECGSEDTHRCWGEGTGSLSYWPQTGELWSVSGRTLFALPLSSVDRALRR